MGTNAKIRINPAGIYLLKVNIENKVCNLFKVNKKKTPERPH